MSELAKILQQETEREGVISFARFMELALYCPVYGYYEQSGRIGRAGDFYTNLSVGALFGELLAFQFVQWLEALTEPVKCLEAGAHDGQLAYDILSWLHQNYPDLCKRLDYWILEPSTARQACQLHKLDKFAQVKWFHSWAALPEQQLSGIIFSNELLDAFPVHRIFWDTARQAWFEWGVTLNENKEFIPRKMFSRDWTTEVKEAEFAAAPELMELLPDGYTIELCPGASKWWGQAARALRRGKLLTIDYGLTAAELLAPERTAGTLRSYYRHHLAPDPLSRPGEQDITAHVNFEEVIKTGEAAGLRTQGLFSQMQFLTSIATKMLEKGTENWKPALVRQFQTLTHPAHLGRAFQVLIQER